MLTNTFVNVEMVHGEWCYTTNRRRKRKKLSLGKGEKEGDEKVKPEITSRRIPVKSMFMGVVRRLRLDNCFDGKILLERVNKSHVVNKRIAH